MEAEDERWDLYTSAPDSHSWAAAHRSNVGSTYETAGRLRKRQSRVLELSPKHWAGGGCGAEGGGGVVVVVVVVRVRRLAERERIYERGRGSGIWDGFSLAPHTIPPSSPP